MHNSARLKLEVFFPREACENMLIFSTLLNAAFSIVLYIILAQTRMLNMLCWVEEVVFQKWGHHRLFSRQCFSMKTLVQRCLETASLDAFEQIWIYISLPWLKCVFIVILTKVMKAWLVFLFYLCWRRWYAGISTLLYGICERWLLWQCFLNAFMEFYYCIEMNYV